MSERYVYAIFVLLQVFISNRLFTGWTRVSDSISWNGFLTNHSLAFVLHEKYMNKKSFLKIESETHVHTVARNTLLF